jgi:hypothetical protein
MKKSILTTTLALALTTFALSASAAEPDEQAKQEARDLMAQGRKARETADLRAALSAFSKADEIMRVPTTGLEVAKTLTAMGRLVEAANAAERVATSPESADEPEAFAKARESARELQRELDARTPRIHVNGVDSQARLELDGMPLELNAAGDGTRVNPGRHVLVAHQGGSKQTKAVEVAEAGGTTEVGFDFGVAAPTSTVAPSPDEHDSSPRKSSKTRTSTIAIYSLSGVAVVGVGTGVALAIGANKRKSDLENSCKPSCKSAAVDQLRTTYVLANVAAAVGVASAAAALTIYLARPSEAELRRRHAAITSISFGASAGAEPGVSLAGSF